MDEKRSMIYKLMAKYIFEIILVAGFMLISYSGFTMNSLSEASKIASASSKETRDIQIMYTRSGSNVYSIDKNEAIDRGTLYVKNPNKTSKSMSVIIQLAKNDTYSIGDIYITFDKEKVDMGIIMSLDDTYEVILGEIDLDAYEDITKEVAIYSRTENVSLDYSFKIVGSF